MTCETHGIIYAADDTCPACDERERIRANILNRITELNTCHKTDNCQELARLIEQYIPEWLDGEK